MAKQYPTIKFYRVDKLPDYDKAQKGSFYFVFDKDGDNSFNQLFLAGPNRYENYSGHATWLGGSDDPGWDSSTDEPSTPSSGAQVDLSNYYTKTEVDNINTNIREWVNTEFLPLSGTTAPTSIMTGGIGFDQSVDSLIYSVNTNGEQKSVLTYDNTSDSVTIGAIDSDNIPTTSQININAADIVINGDVKGNSFYEVSDIRCKEVKGNLDIDKCYGVLEKCQDIIYNLKGKTQLEIGLIAQEIEQFFPEVVKEINGVKTLAYDRLVVICFKLMKDMVARIEKLENK